jgi:hypothetical protein
MRLQVAGRASPVPAIARGHFISVLSVTSFS